MSQLHSPLGESQQVDYKLVFCVLLLHHLIRKHLPVFQSDAHGVGASGQAVHFQALQVVLLRAHQPPLKVVKLDLRGRYVRRELQVELVLDGVGVEQVGADDGFRFGEGKGTVGEYLHREDSRVLIILSKASSCHNATFIGSDSHCIGME